MQTQRMTRTRNAFGRATADRTAAMRGRPSTGLARRADGREPLARALGWFSIGLGVTQILAPMAVAKMMGARPTRRTCAAVRAVGVREITCGIGILARSSPGWLWARVAGDAMDLALLARVMKSRKTNRERATAALVSVAGVAVLDAQCALARSRSRTTGEHHHGIHVAKAITVNRPSEEVYHFWRDFQNWPRFMAHLESVEMLNGRSRWRAKGPGGATIEWEAELTEDRPGRAIVWQSQDGENLRNRGSVFFREAPGGRGTEVVVELQYDPPAGALGVALAKLFGKDPGRQVAEALRRFKQMIEVGEVVVSDASIHRQPHPAEPPENVDNDRRQVLQ